MSDTTASTYRTWATTLDSIVDVLEELLDEIEANSEPIDYNLANMREIAITRAQIFRNRAHDATS